MRDYQREAVAAIAAHLTDGGRGQLWAACGSGKTLMGAWAAERMLPGPALIVVLVPSLALVQQTLTAWRQHTRVDAVLAVCSDDTVIDAPVHLADIDSDTTTDPDKIAAWVASGTGRRLIVGTYISAKRLAAALTTRAIRADVPDLVVFDEAHHLAGRPDFVTRRVLDEDYLPARRRLFMTATPRIDDVRVETIGGLSMDNEEVFGPVLYHYQWSRAISEGHLDDYRIVVAGVTQSQAYAMLRDDARVYVDRPGGPDLRTLAAQAVIAKTARARGLRRILVFCPRVDSAEEFTSTLPSTLARLPAEQRPAGRLYSGRVTSRMSPRARESVMDKLRNPPEGGWTTVANVRCLGEGVDVPAVDAVAFTNPKRSQVDIVQAVGRALRRNPDGSGEATIIVPIVIPDSAEEVGDLDPGDYHTLWQVVRALRAHDETLGVELDSQRSHLPTHNPQLPGRITVEVDGQTSGRLLEEVKALLVKQVTSQWWEGYGRARAYYAEHGHLRVPNDHVTADGFGLGRWIINARQHYRKGWLSPSRVEALDKIGMVWDTRDLAWNRFLRELEKYRAEHGHAAVPQSYRTPDGYPLGAKVNTTRTRGRVPEHVRRALDDLGFIWNARDLAWQRLFEAAAAFRAEYGHLDVPASYRTADGYGLGAALKARRAKWRQGTLDPAEREALEELGMRFDTPPPTEKAWREFLSACDRYVATHGSLADVRRDYVDGEGYALGASISYYRSLRNGTRQGGLSPERQAALEERGMVWRIAPVGDLTSDQRKWLLSADDVGAAVVELIDQGVTQTSIAEALGLHPQYLNSKVRRYRMTGRWPTRGRRRE